MARLGRGGAVEALKDREREGRSLPRSGLGAAEQIPPLEDSGDRLQLDRGGAGIAFRAHGAEHLLNEPKIFETGHRKPSKARTAKTLPVSSRTHGRPSSVAH